MFILSHFNCLRMIISSMHNLYRAAFAIRCRRHRAITPDQSPYTVLPHTIEVKPTSLQMQLLNTQNNVALKLGLYGLEDNTIRLKINEATLLKPRYEIPVGVVLIGEPKEQQ